MNREILAIAKQIRLVILDVDGVLTNGDLFFFESGEYKAFNARDGLGMALLVKAGIEIAVISGNRSESVERRLKKFGVTHIYQGIEDKTVAYQQIKAAMDIDDKTVAYMGDDLIDLPVMKRVGLPAAVANADDFVKQHSLWVSRALGGKGAVRELCELILSAKDLLDDYRREFCSL
ncbi:MAG: hypothetical protein CSA45_02965 [Gammaproteobacteria bacterium]|nr:MAG: hypothetical protein CSA45_02965 [Gammaproteobacteria bacterium]